MSSTARDILPQHRPRGFTGRGDKYLAEVAQALRRLLAKNQQSLVRATCRLPEDQLTQLAVLLVEFGEDIHNEIGLWRTLESFNQETFGHPLPLTAREARPDALKGFDARRIAHLLWGLWGCLSYARKPRSHPNIVLSIADWRPGFARCVGVEGPPREVSSSITHFARHKRFGTISSMKQIPQIVVPTRKSPGHNTAAHR